MAFTVGGGAGHDVRATARMSQLRHMLRALVLDRPGPPDEVVRRLDEALKKLNEPDVTATLIFGLARPSADGTSSLAWANAGHPPPLLVRPDGRARFLAGGEGLPLGVDTDVPREAVTTAPLAEGSLFLLHTDGLIERRGEDLAMGLERLREEAGHLRGLSPDTFLDELVALVAPRVTMTSPCWGCGMSPRPGDRAVPGSDEPAPPPPCAQTSGCRVGSGAEPAQNAVGPARCRLRAAGLPETMERQASSGAGRGRAAGGLVLPTPWRAGGVAAS